MRTRGTSALLALAAALTLNVGCVSSDAPKLAKISRALLPVTRFVVCSNYGVEVRDEGRDVLQFIVSYAFGCPDPFLLQVEAESKNALLLQSLPRNATFEAKIWKRCGKRIADDPQISAFLQKDDDTSVALGAIREARDSELFNADELQALQFVEDRYYEARRARLAEETEVEVVTLLKKSVNRDERGLARRALRLNPTDGAR